MVRAVDAVLEDHPVQADVERLLDHRLRLVGLGRKAREQRHVGLQVALPEDQRPVAHAHQEHVQRRKVQRVVLHVDVDVIDGRARDVAGVGPEGQVALVFRP